MIQFKKVIGITASLLVLGSSLISHNACAASNSYEMNVTLSVSETMAPLAALPQRCTGASLAVGIGMTAGTGTMTITGGSNGPKIVNIPVVLTASDCPTEKFAFSEGRFVLAAANGNTLSATYSGGFLPTSDPKVLPTNLMLDGGTFTITGGTGVFAGASSIGATKLWGTETVYSPPPLLIATGTLNAKATISLPNKNFTAQAF